MSISADRNLEHRRAGKTALSYFEVTALCILFDRVYALFGHGVSSAAMTFMFLYPLLGGALPFGIFWITGPHLKRPMRFSRPAYNAYNSGMAALTVASALTGVFEIAGTSSAYTVVLTAAGAALCAIGMAAFLVGCFRHAQSHTNAAVHR